VSLASAGWLASLLVSLAGLSTPAQAAQRCVVPHSHRIRVLKVTHSVVVYYVHEGESEVGPEADAYLACSRRTNRFMSLGREELDPEYGPENAITDIEVEGDWLAVADTTGIPTASSCGKYMEGTPGASCPSPSVSLELFDVATGRRLAIPGIGVLPGGKEAQLVRVLVSRDGAVAWLVKSEVEVTSSLYGCLASPLRRGLLCTPRLFAEGSIPAASARLSGTTLSWTAGGVAGSSAL